MNTLSPSKQALLSITKWKKESDLAQITARFRESGLKNAKLGIRAAPPTGKCIFFASCAQRAEEDILSVPFSGF